MMKRGCGFEFETEFEGMKGCVYMAAVLEYMVCFFYFVLLFCLLLSLGC